MKKEYTSGELFGGAIPSDIKNIFKKEMNERKLYKWKCPKCKVGVNVNPSASFFKCGNCGYSKRGF